MAYTRKTKRVFGREKDQKNALMRSLARSLVLNEKIKTTEAKAKSLRPFIEKIITKSSSNSLSTIRNLNSIFYNDKKIVQKLTSEIGPKYKDRAGGYTRIIKLNSIGGRSEAIIELV